MRPYKIALAFGCVSSMTLALAACGPSPSLSNNQTTPEPDDMGTSQNQDMGAPNNTSPGGDMSPPGNTSLPARCDGLEDGKRCDGEVRFVCQGGQELEREFCQLGCDAISGECLRDMELPMAWCEGKSDGPHCDNADLVQCSGGQEQSREPCSLGCEQSACKPDTFCQGKMISSIARMIRSRRARRARSGVSRWRSAHRTAAVSNHVHRSPHRPTARSGRPAPGLLAAIRARRRRSQKIRSATRWPDNAPPRLLPRRARLPTRRATTWIGSSRRMVGT